MRDKKYPTRMHEVLGVAENEEFYSEDKMLMRVNRLGRIERKMDTHPCGWDLMCNTRRVEDCINHGITRRPRLTEEQVKHLKGLYLLGFRWIERDEHDALVAWENYDDKADVFQNDFLPLSYRSYQVLIVVPTRNAPLNIVQTLRDAGVEVDDG